jgi:hypothetical protein
MRPEPLWVQGCPAFYAVQGGFWIADSEKEIQNAKSTIEAKPPSGYNII